MAGGHDHRPAIQGERKLLQAIEQGVAGQSQQACTAARLRLPPVCSSACAIRSFSSAARSRPLLGSVNRCADASVLRHGIPSAGSRHGPSARQQQREPFTQIAQFAHITGPGWEASARLVSLPSFTGVASC